MPWCQAFSMKGAIICHEDSFRLMWCQAFPIKGAIIYHEDSFRLMRCHENSFG
jgi:hypothetical protein